MGEPLWATFFADSLETLVHEFPLVFVGHVDTQEKGSRDLYPEVSGGPPPDPLTISVIEVVEVIAGSGVSAGDQVRVQQFGERARDSDGRLVVSHLEGDDLLQVDREYLFFARLVDDEGYEGYVAVAPFGVFTISDADGTLAPLCACWSGLTAVEALDGATLPEATEKAELARAGSR